MTRLVPALICLLLAAPAAAEPWPETGDIVLRFAAEPGPDDLAQRLTDRRLESFERALGAWPVFRLHLAGGEAAVIARGLAAEPGVLWAEPERLPPIVAHGPPVDDPLFAEQWHLENRGEGGGSLVGADINIRPAWDLADGGGLIVGIFDSGVDSTHPDLDVTDEQMNLVTGEPDANPDVEGDGAPHGTAVAGLAAALGNNGLGVAGVATNARVLPVRIIGEGVTTFGIYNGFVFGADNGAAVVNNSWGFTNSDCDPLQSDESLNDAMEYSRLEGRGGLGTVVVFSGGNQGCDAGNNPMLLNPGVIGVAGANDRDRRPNYSSWGQHIDIAAPTGGGGGSFLWTTDIVGDDGYNGAGDKNEYTPSMSGTSGAAPIVAGTVALMISANVRLHEEQVRQVLCDTADKIDLANGEYDASGRSTFYGCGRVNAGAAVAAVANVAPPAPAWADEAVELMAGVDGLAWTQAADPDGDALRWDLQLELDGVEEPLLLEGLTEPRYTALDVGETVTATLWAVDVWGRGLASEPRTVTVVAPPTPPAPEPPEEGNSCTASHAGLGGLGLLPLLVRRRRR